MHQLPALLLGPIFLVTAGLRAEPTLPVDFVSPMAGTGGTGHTYPGAVYPFGLVQLSPDTGVTGWEHCAGYHYPDPTIIGFSHTHLSGTGCPDLGDILFQPTTGAVKWAEGDPAVPGSGYRSRYSHQDETASPGYYSVLLQDYGVKVELTATAHAGMHRYTFPAGTAAHVLIDLVHGVANRPVDALLTVENPTTVSGYRRSTGWAKDKTFFFVAQFSQPSTQADLQANDQVVPGAKEVRDKRVRGCLDFSPVAGQPLLVRIGISPTGVEEARKNLAAEITGWDFDAVRAAARKAWNDQLATVEISARDPAVKRKIYTSLYHTMLAPHLYNNADGSYEGADHQVHAGSFANYCTCSIWDQFRAWFPLMTLVQPARIDDQMNSYLAFYQQENQHALPVWPLAGNETWCMIGYNSVAEIATAQRDGFHGFDAGKLFAAMKDSALNDRNGQDQFHQHGYVAEDCPDLSLQDIRYWQSVSRTLEYAYDDYCIGMMARALGQTADAKTFLGYAANYRNVFDPQTKFMRGKSAAGAWHTPFRPDDFYRNDYTEADAWQYSYTVPQDPQGLITLMGEEIELEAPPQHRFVNRADLPLPGRAGVGDQYIHAAEGLGDTVERSLDRGAVGYIAGQTHAADRLGGLRRSLAIEVQYGNFRAIVLERLGRRRADRAGPAGHHGDLAGQRFFFRRAQLGLLQRPIFHVEQIGLGQRLEPADRLGVGDRRHGVLGDVRGDRRVLLASSQTEHAQPRRQDHARQRVQHCLGNRLAGVVAGEIGVVVSDEPAGGIPGRRAERVQPAIGRRVHDQWIVLGADRMVRRHHALGGIARQLGAVHVIQDGG